MSFPHSYLSFRGAHMRNVLTNIFINTLRVCRSAWGTQKSRTLGEHALFDLRARAAPKHVRFVMPVNGSRYMVVVIHIALVRLGQRGADAECAFGRNR